MSRPPCDDGHSTKRYQSGEPMSRYQPVLLHLDPDDWETFKEVYEKGKLSARVRELMSADLDRFTREETRAQQLAGITEA